VKLNVKQCGHQKTKRKRLEKLKEKLEKLQEKLEKLQEKRKDNEKEKR
jgi:uncharacterized coiled-coil protein SlyX